MRGATETIIPNIDSIKFLLTRPMRGATLVNYCEQSICNISTHTPHAGRDEFLHWISQ